MGFVLKINDGFSSDELKRELNTVIVKLDEFLARLERVEGLLMAKNFEGTKKITYSKIESDEDYEQMKNLMSNDDFKDSLVCLLYL